jgi:hypothetical protein
VKRSPKLENVPFREALLRHKQSGNEVAVIRDGKVVLLQPDEIHIDTK